MKISLNDGWLLYDSTDDRTKENGVCMNMPCLLPIVNKSKYNAKFVFKKSISIDKARFRTFYLSISGVVGEVSLKVNNKNINLYNSYHIGLPFRVDISKYIVDKDNEIILTIQNIYTHEYLKEREKQKYNDMFLGITGEVSILCYENACFCHDTNHKEERADIEVISKILGSKGIFDISYLLYSLKKSSGVLKVFVYDNKGELVESKEKNISYKKKKIIKDNIAINIKNPILWSSDSPNLYTLKIELYENNNLVDNYEIRKGFRELKYDKLIEINDKKTNLLATPYELSYPNISAYTNYNVIYRDIFKLKKAGINTIKLSSFTKDLLEVCQDLGMFVIVDIAKYVKMKTYIFYNYLYRLREFINNYTCIILVDTTYRKSFDISKKYSKIATKIFNKEYKKNQGYLTISEEVKSNAKIISKNEFALHSVNKYKCAVVNAGYNEYNTLSASREDKEVRQLVQCWGYQYLLNKYKGNTPIISLFSAIDSTKESKYNYGILDEYRIEKFSYYFFMSNNVNYNKKFCFVPTFWNNSDITKLPIFTNCDKVSLYLIGEFIGEESVKKEKDIIYKPNKNYKKIAKSNKNKLANKLLSDKDTKKDKFLVYLASTMYNNTLCNNINNPPIVYDKLKYKKGNIKVVSCENNENVATFELATFSEPFAIRLRVDYSGKLLKNDARDIVFVYAEVVDDKGNIILNNKSKISLSIENGSVLGNATKSAKAGIASFLVRADYGAEKVLVKAFSDSLVGESKNIELEKILID